jgi:hypothetical protein
MTDRLTGMTTDNTARTISELLVELIETMAKDMTKLHAENEKILSEFAKGEDK